jgi:hypothetical protein
MSVQPNALCLLGHSLANRFVTVDAASVHWKQGFQKVRSRAEFVKIER